MRFYLPFILVSLLLPVNPAYSGPIRPLSIVLDETFKAKLTLVGEERDKKRSMVKLEKLQAYAENSIEMITREGKNYYQIKENLTLFNEQKVETTSLIEIGDTLKTFSYKRLRRDPEGSVIEKLEVQFDNPSWDYPEDVFCQPAIMLVFKSLVDNGIKESSFSYWQNDMTVLRMKLKIMGREQIKTGLGEFSCYKGMMVLDVRDVLPIGKFLAPLIQPFMPKTYFWLSDNAPYQGVKTETSLAPGGSVGLSGEVFAYQDNR